MKFKIFVLSFFVLAATGVNAQNAATDTVAKSSIKYRAELGYGQTYRYGDYIVTSPYNIIRAGGNVEFPLKNGFGVETGLKYSFAFGNREQQYNHGDTAFFKYSGHLLDVPLRVTYTISIFWGLKLFAYAGPNFNLGLAQTSDVKFEPKKTGQTNPLDLPVSGTYDLYNSEMKRFALQLGAGGGLQWKNYRLKSGYDWGLNNIGTNKDRPERLRGWHVAFEYEF